MKSHQHINQDSGNAEYYTPPEIIEAARETMNGIILDPASSAIANERVKAEHWFSVIDDGLSRSWVARSVWMNHPFSRQGNPLWVNKLISEFRRGHFKESCNITFAATSEAWFKPLLLNCWQCFLSPRTNYFLPNGKRKPGVPKGSVVSYLGDNPSRFAKAFKHLGAIKPPCATP